MEVAVLLAQMYPLCAKGSGGGETCAGSAEWRDRASPGRGEQSEALCA